MAETLLVGKGRQFGEIPRDSWEKKVAMESQHIPAILDFMTKDHHLVRNLVVEEIARKARPASSEEISTKPNMPQSKVIDISRPSDSGRYSSGQKNMPKITGRRPNRLMVLT